MSHTKSFLNSRSWLTSTLCRVKYQTSNGTRPSRARACQSGTWYWMGWVVRMTSTVHVGCALHVSATRHGLRQRPCNGGPCRQRFAENSNPSLPIKVPRPAIALIQQSLPHRQGAFGLANEIGQRSAQRVEIARRQDVARFLVPDNFLRARVARADDGQA